jgi:hypothetical protein
LGCLGGTLLLVVLLVAAAVLAVRLAGGALLRSLPGNPERAPQVAEEIADFDLPAGYDSAVATHLLGCALVGYDGPDGHSHIYLFQLPASFRLDAAGLERQFDSAADDPARTGVELQVIERRAVTIRGQATTLVTSEGTNGEGQTYRSASAVFEGKGGQALLSFSGLTATWDAAMIEAFIASMR